MIYWFKELRIKDDKSDNFYFNITFNPCHIFEIFKKIEIIYYTKSNKKIILLLVYSILNFKIAFLQKFKNSSY